MQEDDDEASLAEAEEAERGGYADEMEALQREGEMTVEELRRLYYGDGEEGHSLDR
jgi:hypothetical protein